MLFLPEWHPQSGVQITWPDAQTDWAPMLDDVLPCYAAIAREIAQGERLLVVCRNEVEARRQLGAVDNVLFFQTPIDDTWARDYAPLSALDGDQPVLLDFQFNGWGLKYPAERDNNISHSLFAAGIFAPQVGYRDLRRFVLEGGSIETDGLGTLLTTSSCILSANRNGFASKAEAERFFAHTLGIRRCLWLDDGHIDGDDTDGHIDTLARFCDAHTIAYVQCTDPRDPNYPSLRRMEQQLRSFTRPDGQPYRLIPLPTPPRITYHGSALPATYANFLILNHAVLLPFYDAPTDAAALSALRLAFPSSSPFPSSSSSSPSPSSSSSSPCPSRPIIGIPSLPLLRQNGSLHCMTMQFASNTLRITNNK